jgi:hypothetical protein
VDEAIDNKSCYGRLKGDTGSVAYKKNRLRASSPLTSPRSIDAVPVASDD